MRKVAERGHQSTRIRAHRRPDTAVRRAAGPLATDRVALLEYRRIEAVLDQILGCREPGRAGADDRYVLHRATPLRN